MTLMPDHPDGIIHCDVEGCARTRRHWCKPAEADEWESFMRGTQVLDHCPAHRTNRETEQP